MKIQRKHIVLGVLFLLPLVVYMFFASGVNNFAKLDVVSEDVLNTKSYKTLYKDSIINFEDKITVLSILGSDVSTKKAFAFNLKEKIYDRFKDFNDLQFVSVVTPNQKPLLDGFIEAVSYTSSTDKWIFIEVEEDEIQTIFNSLKTPYRLDDKFSTTQVFIIDKNLDLRGRAEDDDGNTRYSYDMSSVSELSKEMIDDIKVILAEYRLALKKYNRE
jgi:hypothetical protein